MSNSPKRVSKYKYSCSLLIHIKKESVFSASFTFHHRFCWPSFSKKILDGFCSHTTGHNIKKLLNQMSLESKPPKNLISGKSKDGIDIGHRGSHQIDEENGASHVLFVGAHSRDLWKVFSQRSKDVCIGRSAVRKKVAPAKTSILFIIWASCSLRR